MQQIVEMIAQREAAIAALQTELEALRLTASLLAEQEKEEGKFGLSQKGPQKLQNEVFSAGNGQPVSKAGPAKGQFV